MPRLRSFDVLLPEPGEVYCYCKNPQDAYVIAWNISAQPVPMHSRVVNVSVSADKNTVTGQYAMMSVEKILKAKRLGEVGLPICVKEDKPCGNQQTEKEAADELAKLAYEKILKKYHVTQ